MSHYGPFREIDEAELMAVELLTEDEYRALRI